MVIESTGCRDKQAALHVLAERVKRVEHIKAGILTWQQCRMADFAANPLARLSSADEHSVRRKTRWALTVQELERFFTAARLRPLAEYGRETVRLLKAQRKGRKTWHKEPLRFEMLELAAQRGRLRLKDKPGLIDELEWLGRERALMYKTLALTGLRRGELASITLAQVWLDMPQPYLELKAKDEKNGRGVHIPLRSDLAAEIAQFITDTRQRHKSHGYLMPLFDMPDSLIGIFDRAKPAAKLEAALAVN
jgi:integrase